MKNKRILTFMALCTGGFLWTPVVAQTDSPEEDRAGFHITHFSILSGGWSGNYLDRGLEDFRTLAPGSALLNKDFSNYDQKVNWFTNVAPLTVWSMGLQTAKGNKMDQIEWNVGLVFSEGTARFLDMSQVTYSPWDTIRSSRTGKEYYVDSVHSSYYSMDFYQKMLGLDISARVKTRLPSRTQLFVGVGVQVLAGLPGITTIRYTETKGTTVKDESGNRGFYFSDLNTSLSRSEREVYSNDPAVSTGAYIPMGLDFTLGKKNAFLRHLSMGLELRPGVILEQHPELGSQTFTYLGNVWGLKWTL